MRLLLLLRDQRPWESKPQGRPRPHEWQLNRPDKSTLRLRHCGSGQHFSQLLLWNLFQTNLSRHFKKKIHNLFWTLSFKIDLNLEFTIPSCRYFFCTPNLIASLKLFRRAARATTELTANHGHENNGQCPWLESRARLFHFGRARGYSHRHTRMYKFAWKGIICFESARPEKFQINLDKTPLGCSLRPEPRFMSQSCQYI